MKLKELNPKIAYHELIECLDEFKLYKKYKQIISDLQQEGRLEEIGFSVDDDANLYLGINLNPELLMYSETSQESVELRLVSEKMGKYNDFLTKEGILDSVKMDYDRVKNDQFYGYVLRISFKFKKYSEQKYKRSIAHLVVAAALTIGAIVPTALILF